MKKRQRIVVGFGEIVWDRLPQDETLGGAPTNFAYQANCLGDHGIVVSAVGADRLGHSARNRLESLGLGTEFVQTNRHPTGIVDVALDEAGQPRFEIRDEVAWDHLEWTPALEGLARGIDAVCYGSLAQRAPQSRAVLRRFLIATRGQALRVFDVNLRPPFFDGCILDESLKLADVVKLNEEELGELIDLLSLDREETTSMARRILERYSLRLVCVTRGRNGSLLLTRSQLVEHPGKSVQVTDTVGAGDAYLAAMVHFYLKKAPLAVVSQAANRLGAWVASQPGATPAGSRQAAQRIRSEFGNRF